MRSAVNATSKYILIAVIALGVFFRFYNIDRKIYWHDEVYTIFRSGGYTRDEIDREIFVNRIIPAQELTKYLAIKPQSTVMDTLRSLALEDPQHPPLYFVLTRYWIKLFGNSVTVVRFLPASISLISLFLIYFLTLEIFGPWFGSQTSLNLNLVGLIAVGLLSLSPVDILFAQTARQYSSLTLGTIGSVYFLIKALRLQNLVNWIGFSLFTALGFYVHPFFAFNLVALAVFMVLAQQRNLFNFFLCVSVSLILYSPWIVVIFSNLERALSTTNWATIDVGFDYLAKLWILSFTSLFFDLDVGFNNILTYIFRLPFLVLIFGAVYYLLKLNSKNTTVLLLGSAFIPFMVLVSADLILGGKRSAVTRYLISCFPFVQIMVAHLLTKFLNQQKTIGFVSLICLGSLSSIIVSSQAYTWWNKDLSYNNASIIQIVNQQNNPIVISDIGNDFTNTGDLIAMSPRFNPDVKLLLLSKEVNLQDLHIDVTNPLFVFRASHSLLAQLKDFPSDYKMLQ